MSRHTVTIGLSALVVALSCAAIAGEPKVFKYDQFAEDLPTAVTQMNNMSLATQPGFAQHESFGQIYRPHADAYPMKLTGFDIVLAAPPLAPQLTANALIEIYNSEEDGPDPLAGPLFVMSTADMYNRHTGEFGVPLQGQVAFGVEFDYNDPANHPPFITSGNVWLMIRFEDPASDGLSTWGDLQCAYWPDLGACGCQNVGTIQDTSTTSGVNVLKIVDGVGNCSGTMKWDYAETIGVTGDFVMRLHTEVATLGCVSACDGRTCGGDGCGGSCGECEGDDACFEGQCVSCVPQCLAKQCGDDGCGGSCGECEGDKVCSGAGSCCTPTCGDAECGGDGCGGSCGTCAGGETCSAGICEAPTCVRSCDGKSCGDDGCGSVCGVCLASERCNAGTCEATGCAPSCDGRSCGDDGCGGVCGTCSGDDTCSAGVCAAPGTQALALLDISPASGASNEATAVSISGASFEDGARALVGGTELANVTVVSAGLITGDVPAGIRAGTYTVIVTNPGGATARLLNAYEVVDGVSAGDSAGCQGAPSPPIGWILGLLLAAGLSTRWRARRSR